MSDVKKWAIQNEATGEWWGCSSGVGWGNVIDVYRYSYVNAVSAVTEILRGTTTARIVPAPPREMTDAECWEWLQPQQLVIFGQAKNAPNPWAVLEWKPSRFPIAYGKTPCDAIRAARRNLERK